MLVPLAAWWLQVSLWQALLLDLGFFAFFLPYTYVFNLAYDRLASACHARQANCGNTKQINQGRPR
jgi:uncharacterized membrane protein